MVRALLAGAKTQTRRIIKPRVKPSLFDGTWTDSYVLDPGNQSWRDREIRIKVGDRLWVRESGQLLREAYDHDPVAREDLWRDAGFCHAANGEIIAARAYDPPLREWIDDCSRINRPSIHMPRWASRLTLTVTDVRVQRLTDISEEDARAEGVEPGFGGGPIIEDFFCLWNSIHGAFATDASPWVAAYTFTVERRNIDEGRVKHADATPNSLSFKTEEKK